MLRDRSIVERPFLVVLDGLDECKGKEAQCEFMDLVSEYVRLTKEYPILWMIYSRPEWNLKSMLSDADYDIECLREEIAIDSFNAKVDVRRVLCL